MTDTSTSRRTILVIEDNSIDYELVRRLLPPRYRTIHAPSAADGMRTVASADVACVLLDYRLPDLDGIELLAELVGREVPVVLMTGHGDTQIAVDAMKRGAADYLRKERLDAETLTRTVDGAIERAMLKRDLAHREAELRALAAKLPAIVWTVDPAGLITTLYGARLELLGPAGVEAMGKTWAAVFGEIVDSPDDAEQFSAAHVTALAGGASRFELHLRGRTFEGHVVGLLGPTGTRMGATGLLLDVSEAHDLEHKLVQAQKLEALGRLAGGLAHDMNNILTAVVSFTTFARDEARDGTQLAEDLDEVLRAADRGTKLLRQMLLFSRRETFARDTVDLRATVHETLPMLRRLVGEDCRIDVVDTDEDTYVQLDRSELDQIVVNLTVNARDAIKGAGRILIELSAVSIRSPFVAGNVTLAPGDYVVLKVSDSGAGIPPELIDRIFEPFFTTKERGKGTGLGLSTCHGIAQRSGGTISITSELGRGTQVAVYLPRSPLPPAEDKTAVASGARGGTETVLYVEDDTAIRSATARVLRKLGYVVLEAEDLATALIAERRHDGEIAIVITDIVLPDGSGRDVIARLRETRPMARALYVSGYAPDSLRLRGVLDVTDVLEKPFTLAELTRRVRAKLDETNRGRSLAPS